MIYMIHTCVNSKGEVNADLDGVVVLGEAVAGSVFEVAELSLAPRGARGHFSTEGPSRGDQHRSSALGWAGSAMTGCWTSSTPRRSTRLP
jgi:hypothetical protein